MPYGCYGLPSVPSSPFIRCMSPEETAGQLQATLNALAPDGCAGVVAPVGADALAGLSPEEAELIQSWAPHRRQEFATGRQCARQALAALSAKPEVSSPDADGLPNWPEGYLGSISHSRGVAAAVAAPLNNYALLGLDLEKTNRLCGAAMRRVLHPQETSFAAGDQARTSILFSLKEAFYKAQFPRWRTAGNFGDLALAVDLETGTARVMEMDARFAPELEELRFAFRVVGEYVVSLAWL